MNPHLKELQPYPFQRLSALFAGIEPANLPVCNLSIGEPKHPTPKLVCDALASNLASLGNYPATLGIPELRTAIATWIQRRFDANLDPDKQILPVLGSREALFSFAQTVLSGSSTAKVAFPNPFYQIYEGAALLGNAAPVYLNVDHKTGLPNFEELANSDLTDVELLYVCSPNNPTGSVISIEEWKLLFDLADKFNFVLASDECYSEIYQDESNPPLGALAAAARLGRSSFENLVVFSSLSKRSNSPGLRSGFVAGDADLLSNFLKYRTYHGSAMSVPIQKASIAAWNDEAHVLDNREQYRQKFKRVGDVLSQSYDVTYPEAGFYFWLPINGCDETFAKKLLAEQNVIVLPGSYLGRNARGQNPGQGFVRVALVAPLEDCVTAAKRMVNFASAHGFGKHAK